MPIIVEHKIDKNSPFRKLLSVPNDSNDLADFQGFLDNDFEILVTLEGLNQIF